MISRRQERVARVIKEVVSDAVLNHLNDPRIQGFVSVTRVSVTPDLRSADVYLSIFATGAAQDYKTQAVADRSFAAIVHARSRIHSLLASRMRAKFCPALNFYSDKNFKKSLETMKIIDQAVSELKEREAHRPASDPDADNDRRSSTETRQSQE
jgi:ribosome-binding factor A